MSWHYSQEQEAGFSLQTYLDGIRSARLRSRSTRAKSCCNGNATGCSTTSQSGTMCEPSTANLGEDSLMLFRGDFPVKTSVQRVKVQDSPEPVAVCGSNISASLMRFGLALCLQKTHRTCERVGSARSSMDLPSWGMTSDGECWELGTSVQIINETGCGYWPTPTVCGNHNRKGASKHSGDGLATAAKLWPTPKASQVGMSAKTTGRGVEKSTHLSTQVALAEGMIGDDGKLRKQWPTPTKSDGTGGPRVTPRSDRDPLKPSDLRTAARLWPTPQASDNRPRATEASTQRRREIGKQISLEAAVKFPTPTVQDAKNNGSPSQMDRNTPPLNAVAGGSLNPPWVEWLMGWPLGWTDLKPLETDKFQQWRRLHLRS